VENVYINEVMASNVNETMDEAGEYEDWIELYNAGSEEVNLAGLFLADSYPAPDPWKFPLDQPAFTILPPNEFMVVFADGEPADGPLHTSFKLSKSGEEVVLLQKIGADTLIIDRMAFGIQARNKTFGRYPDGSSMLEYLAEPTPWASNLMTFTGPAYPYSKSEPQEEVTVYPVPTDGPLYIKVNRTTPDTGTDGGGLVGISVYSISGALVAGGEYDSSGVIQLSLEGQPAGLYLLRIHSGDTQHVKRVILH
jgi:hypothetical protein